MFKTSKISALHDRKLLVVIGNGFDLDLKLKTSYKDFMISETFKEYRNNSHSMSDSYCRLNLFDYLQERFDGNDKKWIDVEVELREFAKSIDLTKYNNEKTAIDYIEASFNQVRCALNEYLNGIDYSSINIQSTAIEALKAMKRGRNCIVYDFNYTDLSRLNTYIGGEPTFKVLYIHGTLEEESIVLGFENIHLRYPSLDFMIKYQSDYYTPSDIRIDLEDAEEVLVFGHTLGCTDHSYFQDFFQRETNHETRKQTPITIVTLDAKSRRLINREINEMTEDKAEMLNVIYIQTHGNTSPENIHSFFNALANRITPNIERSILR